MNKSSFGLGRQSALNNILNGDFPSLYTAATNLANVWSVPFAPYLLNGDYQTNSNQLQSVISGLDLAWSDSTGQTQVTSFNNAFSTFSVNFELLRTDLITNNEYPGHTESDLEWPGIFDENLDEIGDCLCTFFQQFATLNPLTQALLLQLQAKINAYYTQLSTFLSGQNYGEMAPAPATTPCDKFKEIKRFLTVYKEYFENEGNY
jgi:hypothetical protein